MLEIITSEERQKMLEEAAKEKKYNWLEEHLENIKDQLKKNPTPAFITSAEEFIEAINAKKAEYEAWKKEVQETTGKELENLKEEIKLSEEIKEQLDSLKIIQVLSSGTNLNFGDVNIKSALSCIINPNFKWWDSRTWMDKAKYKPSWNGYMMYTKELENLNALKAEYDKPDWVFKSRVEKVIADPKFWITKTSFVPAQVQSATADVAKDAGKAKTSDWTIDTKANVAIPTAKTPDLQTRTTENVDVKKELNKWYKKLFGTFLNLWDKEYTDIDISSFVDTFKKVDGDKKENWETAWYTHDWIVFSDAELDRLNKLKEKYSNDSQFKTKLEKIINYKNKEKDPNFKDFMKSMKKEWHKRSLEDSTYEIGNFAPTNMEYVANFISDANWDGKLEWKNKFDRKWYFLWLAGENVLWQNLSEVVMQDALSSKFSDIKWFNILLKRFGIEEVTAETTQEQLKLIKEKFWEKLTEKMTILWSNGKLEWFYSVLDGKEKEYMDKKLKNEENLENRIDELLNKEETEGQIKSQIKELKDKYWLEKAESPNDLIIIKELLKWTIKQNTDIQYWLWFFAKKPNTHPRWWDLLWMVIKAVGMWDYNWIIWFYVSKKIYETEDKKWAIHAWTANFIPYISASYAVTAYNSNKDKIWKAEKLEGNYTVVPFVALSPISFAFWAELNFNDKNRAINEHINITSKIFHKSEENSYIKLGENWELNIDKDRIIKEYDIQDNENALASLESVLKQFEQYYNDYKTTDPKLNRRLLNHLKTATVNFVSNELYRKNEWWNISWITIWWLFSLINPATFASFIWINWQSRSIEYEEDSDKTKLAEKSRTISSAAQDLKEASQEEFKKLWLKAVTIERWWKQLSVYEYSWSLRNFYAWEEVQIEEDATNNKIYISGKIDTILKVKMTDNNTSEECLSFNWEIEKSNYKTTITEGIHSKTIITQSKKTAEIATWWFEQFENKDKIKELINGLFEKNNSQRYKKSFLNFQNSVGDMYTDKWSLDIAWDKLWIFVKGLPKDQKKLFTDFMNSIQGNAWEKERVMKAILWLTAWDWRIRLFNELHADNDWAKEQRKTLNLKKDFKIWDIKDEHGALIDSLAIRKAEQDNLIRYFGITDNNEKQKLRDNFDKYYNDYNQQNKLAQQWEKPMRIENNSIVFQNFTQMNGDGKKTFHKVLPTYWNEEIHDWQVIKIDIEEYRYKFLDKIPDSVLVSKFAQILAKLESDSNDTPAYKELLAKMKEMKTAEEKISFIKWLLKWENNNEAWLKWSFDLSFVRWSTCLNSGYMINNMKFSINEMEIVTILPKLWEAEVNIAANTKNISSSGSMNVWWIWTAIWDNLTWWDNTRAGGFKWLWSTGLVDA